MIARLLAYLVENRVGAILGLLLTQFLPLLSSFSLVFQSFYIINRGSLLALPLIVLSGLFNQFTIPMFLGGQEQLFGFMVAFLSAHLILLGMSSFFAWCRSFEYTSLVFAVVSSLIIFFFQQEIGFETFKNIASTNFQLELSDEMIKEMMAMAFISYSFLSFVFGILLQNSYFGDSIKFAISKVCLGLVVVLGIANIAGATESYAFQLAGSAVLIVALSQIYDMIKSVNRYAGLTISILSVFAVLYLEFSIYFSIGFVLWDFFGKKLLSRG